MSTVVITGCARGFGYELAKVFHKSNWNVVLSDINEEGLHKAEEALKNEKGEGQIIGVPCNVTDVEQIENLFLQAKRNFGQIDIWVNNAGVNQPNKPVYELTKKEIDFLMDIDLKGIIYGSSIAFKYMKDQEKGGQIYNIEGYGSNDAMMTGLSIYGTSKRATTYFTRALAKEAEDLTKGKVKVCRLTPGIMITDFIKTANGGATHIELPEKTKKVYNILGDYPSTIAEYAVPRMIKNTKNDARIMWLTNRRAFARFLFAGFHKRDFFKEDNK